jgi:hypothetical protein
MTVANYVYGKHQCAICRKPCSTRAGDVAYFCRCGAVVCVGCSDTPGHTCDLIESEGQAMSADKLTRTVSLEIPPVAYDALCTLAERCGGDVAQILEDCAVYMARIYMHADERYQRQFEYYVSVLRARDARGRPH